MPRRKEPVKYAILGPKNCWHVYGLQMLTPKKFADVVGEILQGRHTLVRTRIPNQPLA